jgi:2-aminoethylphosphonate-pyruvate transaminase
MRSRDAVEGVGRAVAMFEVADFGFPDLDRLAAAIDADRAITHVFVCHVETGTGAQNPVEAIGAIAKARGKGLIIDAIAAYGAIPLDIAAVDAEAVIVSPNKCFEGVPGMALPIIRRDVLAASKGRYGSFVLDLHARHEQYEDTGQWRFTPPTHITAAVHAAVKIHEAEGGQPARLAKYRRNWRRLVDGMRQLGISTLIDDTIASPIIATFHRPADPSFDWATFHAGVKARGFWLFNGKLTAIPTFRIGCMGDVSENDVGRLVEAIADTLDAMGVRERAPGLIAAE